MRFDAYARTTLLIALAVGLFAGCSTAGNGSEGLGAYPKSMGAADEGSAIQALRTIATAQTQAKAMRNS
ncbi:MAG TPA: hypothetical protein VE961_11705, partial [Pyrinomonadaceae bacterium]|nr:hypothetical protein [Pyrinomonadaceae bacterium]